MTRSDRVRRAVSLTLAVLCFLVVPQLAFGQFSSSTAPSLNVSTAKLLAPSAATGTYRCNSFFLQWVNVSVTGLTVPTGQAPGVSYEHTLFRDGVERDSATTTADAPRATLESGSQLATSSTTYRLRVVTKLGNWTAKEFNTTFTCGLGGSSGSL